MIEPLPWVKQVRLLWRKEILCEFRGGYAAATMVMFAVIVTSSLGLVLDQATVTPVLGAALFWLTLLLCSMAGLAQSFVQEKEAGTLLALRLYATPQVVLFAKLLFNTSLLSFVSVPVFWLFMLFFNLSPGDWHLLFVLLAAGIFGFSLAAVLTSAIIAQTPGRTALFPVLTFPLLLPLFLLLVKSTGRLFAEQSPDFPDICAAVGFDIAMLAGISLLFDYLWEE